MPMNNMCNHPRCYGEPCKMLTPEELEPTPADIEYGKQLVAEGWKSVSTKYRMVARLTHIVTGKDLVRPELHDTEIGRYMMEQWDNSWADWFLRCGREGVEQRELTVKQYRAFRQAGGQSA